MLLSQVKKMKDEFIYKDYDAHFNMLDTLIIFERMSKDIEMGKHFSIVVYSLMEMMKETGILGSELSDVRKGGTKVYNFKKNHLLELHQLMSKKDLQPWLNTLFFYKQDMDQFRIKVDNKIVKGRHGGASAAAVDADKDIDEVDVVAVMDRQRRINQKYKDIKEDERAIE